MGKEFVPYELALKLRELGFGNKRLDFYLGCFAYYGNEASNLKSKLIPNNIMRKHSKFNYSEFIMAPLWQQAFDWFHKEHNLFAEFSFNTLRNKYDWCIPVNINKGYCSQEEYNTYEEARLECLKKLIEIIENEKL